MVVQGREEAVVAAHVEHVDEAVPARRRQQAKTKQKNKLEAFSVVKYVALIG